METSVSIGRRLREERERTGLNQTDFAGAASATRQTQSNYEKGERMPDAVYLSAIAAMGVDVQYILTGVRAEGATALPLAEPPMHYRSAETDLSRRERFLLENYRASSPRGRKAIEAAASALAQPDEEMKAEG